MENEKQENGQQEKIVAAAKKRLLVSAESSECELHMYEKTKVRGVFQCADVMFQKYAVKCLLTPIGVHKSAYAYARTSDVLFTRRMCNKVVDHTKTSHMHPVRAL